MKSSASIRPRVKKGLLLGFLLVLTVLAAFALTRENRGRRKGQPGPVFAAKRGPLTISVTESGTIKAREKEVIKSQVEGQTTIIYLIPEGTRVKAGELLVELDTSTLEDKQVEQQIKVQNAETAFIRARENLEVVKNQSESDIAQATLEHRFAKEDRDQYKNGEFPKLLKEAEARITLEEEELENAIEKLKWSKRLFEEKYISQTELEADRLAQSRATLDCELAKDNRDLLTNYTFERSMDELNSNIEQTKRALERVKIKANADIIQAEADLRSKEAEYDQQKEKLAKIGDQIRKAKMYASVDGMVVYATSSRANWRGNNEPLDEGQSVRERQELIHLPTTDAIMAEIKVHESNLDKISVGLPVRVRVDALPGVVLQGRVAKIAPLPDAQSMFMNPDLKVYGTQIDLDRIEEELRTGMSCQAEIVVDHYDDVVYVPVQCVVREEGETVAYVDDGDTIRRQPVELGLDNNRVARIISGINENELVLLTPPLRGHEEHVESDILEPDEAWDSAADHTESPESVSVVPAAARDLAPAEGADPRERGGNRPHRAGRRGGEGRQDGSGPRARFQNASPEERARMREEFMKNMTPEQRERWQQRRESREGSRPGRGNRRDDPQ